eukprot:g8195.t1
MLVASVSGMPGVEQIVARQPTRRCAPNFPEVDRYSSMAIGTITYLGVMNQAWNMASISAKAFLWKSFTHIQFATFHNITT